MERRGRLSIVLPEQRRLKAADGRGRPGVAQIWQHLLRNVLFEKLQRPSRSGVVAVDHCNNKKPVVFRCSEYIHKKEHTRKRRRRARHTVPPWQVSRVGNRSTSMITLPRLLFNGRCQVFLKISYCIAVERACTRPGQRFYVSHENKIFDSIFSLFFPSYARALVSSELFSYTLKYPTRFGRPLKLRAIIHAPREHRRQRRWAVYSKIYWVWHSIEIRKIARRMGPTLVTLVRNVRPRCSISVTELVEFKFARRSRGEKTK